MNMIPTVVFSAALTVFLSGCTQAPAVSENRDSDIQAIKDVEIQWNKDYVAKDFDKIAAHYADDAVLIAPGAPASKGKDAVQKTIKEMLTDPALSLKFQAARVEMAKSGDMAYTQGSYTMVMTDPGSKKPITDKGSYVTTYRKQADGGWKAVADIASSEAIPGAPASK